MDIDSLRHAKVEEKPVENYKSDFKELRIEKPSENTSSETRQELKTMFLQQDYSNVKEKKQIIVDYNNNPYWVGYGTIEILSDGPDGYSSFKTHQEFPLEYVETREEYQSGDYELIINGEKYDKLEMFDKTNTTYTYTK